MYRLSGNEGQTGIDPHRAQRCRRIFSGTGKKPGRGAYICPNTECLAKAQKSKGLERSFKAPVPKDVYEALLAQLEGEENHA